ncbi:hypothetical protein EYZ11_008959 [Aspergillus tanneri]|uniref:Uncharacterized protein n=1 Tax=Aspergillus tanneri TaxID=1220188 RepID=A0A4S3JEN6_9EURO|nr:hypothetical protein EYZ11_008959 [Aspergillus tanneri]
MRLELCAFVSAKSPASPEHVMIVRLRTYSTSPEPTLLLPRPSAGEEGSKLIEQLRATSC